MKENKIKPVPKYIVKLIRKRDKEVHPKPCGNTRFYSYLTKNDGELVKVTVAVRHRYSQWHYKQVAVHGVHSDICFIKDIVFYYISGYSVGWYAEGLTKDAKWYESTEWGWHEDRLFDPYAPIVNRYYLAKLPEYKYAAWELFNGTDILKYLRIYEQYPQAEYLMKLGLQQYAMSKQILQKAGTDKRFQKWLSLNRTELANHYYYVSTVFAAYRRKEALPDVQKFEEKKKCFCREKDYKPIREMLNGDYKAYFAYAAKQDISHRLYLDYVKACTYLGLDMTLPKNRYPHDFKRWHDIRTDEYRTAKAIADEKERAELYAKFAVVAEKYLPLQRAQDDVYIALIAKSPAELIAEGDALGHCVGRMGYDQKFVREETLIFFIRSVAEPDVPLITIEYSISSHRILQSYGKNHRTPDGELEKYIRKKWLPYANKALKKIAA